jgi:hypothetical protein
MGHFCLLLPSNYHKKGGSDSGTVIVELLVSKGTCSISIIPVSTVLSNDVLIFELVLFESIKSLSIISHFCMLLSPK